MTTSQVSLPVFACRVKLVPPDELAKASPPIHNGTVGIGAESDSDRRPEPKARDLKRCIGEVMMAIQIDSETRNKDSCLIFVICFRRRYLVGV